MVILITSYLGVHQDESKAIMKTINKNDFVKYCNEVIVEFEKTESEKAWGDTTKIIKDFNRWLDILSEELGDSKSLSLAKALVDNLNQIELSLVSQLVRIAKEYNKSKNYAQSIRWSYNFYIAVAAFLEKVKTKEGEQ